MQIQIASKVNLEVYGTRMMMHAWKDRKDSSSFIQRIPYL